MKRSTVHDERVLAQRRKISSEAFTILMLVLLVSISVQQFLFKAPFEQYAVEFICFFGISLYILIRHLTLGVNVFGEAKNAGRVTLINSMVTGLTITVITGVLNYASYAEQYNAFDWWVFFFTLVMTFGCATAASLTVLTFINLLNSRKQRQIQEKLDEEEQDD